MGFSKSDYTQARACIRAAWLNKYHPETAPIDENTQARMDTGRKVGELARGLFGDFKDVTAYHKDGRLNLPQMIINTGKEMEKDTPVICEAAFSYQDLYCAVDLLHREGDGWAIYEVKSSTDPNQEIYITDVSYQKYVLEKCGVHVSAVYLVTINSDYVFDGTLNLREFFRITDVTAAAAAEEVNVPAVLAAAEKALASEEEPVKELEEGCFDCAFWPYCTKELPVPNVFNLYRLGKGKKLEYYRNGLVSFDELRQSGLIKNDKQRRQMEHALTDKATWIDREGIQKFLSNLSYPLYFLDFETMQPAVPFCIGTRPYAQIPFQYSLHFIESENGRLMHREFLAESGTDPRRAIAEALCRDIPENVCVTAYNKSFECTRLKELAQAFPDLADHLTNIADHIVDLLVPFQSGYYYNRAMGGSFSIKSVLPALYPNNPTLDYHNLEGVHNGGEAMSIFPRIQFMQPDEQETARKNLLKYCELDTYAMVKVWEELSRAVG